MRPEAELAARRWRLVLPRLALSGAQGDRRARGVGSSVEFETHRGFAPGDDPRRVDWRVFARTERLQVRLSRAEVAPAIDVVVDTSASMAICARKATAVSDLVAALDVWGRGAGMRVRLLAADGGPLDAERLVFEGAERELLPRVPLRPRSVRVVVSDFLWPSDPAPRLVRVAADAAHLLVVQILDPDELEPARAGAVALVDCESGATLETALDAARIATYRDRLERLCRSVDQAARRVGSRLNRVTVGAPAAMFEELGRQGMVEPA